MLRHRPTSGGAEAVRTVRIGMIAFALPDEQLLPILARLRAELELRRALQRLSCPARARPALLAEGVAPGVQCGPSCGA